MFRFFLQLVFMFNRKNAEYWDSYETMNKSMEPTLRFSTLWRNSNIPPCDISVVNGKFETGFSSDLTEEFLSLTLQFGVPIMEKDHYGWWKEPEISVAVYFQMCFRLAKSWDQSGKLSIKLLFHNIGISKQECE